MGGSRGRKQHGWQAQQHSQAQRRPKGFCWRRVNRQSACVSRLPPLLRRVQELLALQCSSLCAQPSREAGKLQPVAVLSCTVLIPLSCVLRAPLRP
jgi:hypothetical protein